jgi:H+-translocating NAD(P) transhydrogenase subunit alpha
MRWGRFSGHVCEQTLAKARRAEACASGQSRPKSSGGSLAAQSPKRKRFKDWTDMHIGIPAETRAGEARVAATPETVKKYVALGHRVRVEHNAGAAASQTNAAYEAAGAQLCDAAMAFGADLVLKVQAPTAAEIPLLRRGAVLVGMLDPFNGAQAEQLAGAGLTAFALEAAPRTTRAQSLDVLSSQANIAGYKAVLLAAHLYPRFMPMLMTAAGTVKAARVLILGAGVAGLQAIATAKRLGAVIEASDVRPAVKEQIESLGAKFLDLPYETDEEREAAQGVGGYARPMPQSWLVRQAALVNERIKQADIVISTALIPGRDAPTLVSAEAVSAMKPGSVLIDLAAGRGPVADEATGRRGGNCPLTVVDEVTQVQGVTIAGPTNLAAQVPADASALYARNLLDFLKLIVNKEGELSIDMNDDIVAATLLCRDGELARK